VITFQDSIEVAQSQTKVFGFISDLDNLPKIQTEVVQSRVVTPGPIAVGTRFEELVKLGPWRVPTHCVVTEYDPRGTMGFRGESKPINYESSFTVDAHAAGSRVTVRGTAQLNGLWRLLEPLLAADVRKGIRHELMAIRRHTEGDGRG
jgi:hypothetical protein